MLKVNEERLLTDYKYLQEKRDKKLKEIEADAKAYATAHGYDEEKTAKFVEFTQQIEGKGLTVDENIKLEILGSYIEEVEEEITEMKCNIVPTDENEVVADSTVTTIQNV